MVQQVMPPKVVAIFGLVVVAMITVYGFQAALADAGERNTVVNETFTPSAGTITELENSNLNGAYYENTTSVYNDASPPDEMDRGTDYRWYESNGTVEAVSGGGLDGESSATISYQYQQTTGEQRGIAKVLSMLGPFLEVGMILGGVMLLLAFLKV